MIIFLVLDDEDNRILSAIYAKNKKRLLNVAKSYLGDRAEDAVQDVFVKLINKYDGNIEALCDKEGYYFVTIVKNHAIDILRKEKQIEADSIDDDSSVFIEAAEEPEEALANRNELERMIGLIKKLKPDYRQVLEYKFLLQLSNTEIAEELSVSPSVVSSRINRARNQLRELMEGEDHDRGIF